MAQSRKSRQTSQADGRKDTIMHRDLTFDTGPTQESAFERADLVFEGVDHTCDSYEVRVFLNNKNANEQTARSPETATSAASWCSATAGALVSRTTVSLRSRSRRARRLIRAAATSIR
jgi:hypothetical protein